MNKTFDQSTLLKQLSKNYVVGELGLDPKSFVATTDAAWIPLAAKLLQLTPQAKRLRKTISSK